MNKLRNQCFAYVQAKTRYRDKDEALEALHSCQRKAKSDIRDFGQTGWNQQRVYKCEHCKGWHLTSQPLTNQKVAA